MRKGSGRHARSINELQTQTELAASLGFFDECREYRTAGLGNARCQTDQCTSRSAGAGKRNPRTCDAISANLRRREYDSMKILTKWLRAYLPELPKDDAQLAEDLTLARDRGRGRLRSWQGQWLALRDGHYHQPCGRDEPLRRGARGGGDLRVGLPALSSNCPKPARPRSPSRCGLRPRTLAGALRRGCCAASRLATHGTGLRVRRLPRISGCWSRSDLQRRGCHQLCLAGDGPAHACLRSGQD